MQAYKFDTTISEKGTISLPSEPQLFNMEVEVIIVPKGKNNNKEKKDHSASDFLKKWSGVFKNMTDEEIDNAKYEYLMKKHK
ncbi:MAG: hypothetical protein LBN93_02820 [Candidatus Symbiothrix sp.]|jgi:hypothetical protein|nr:hypothetical protein [Candidatus Symbiothrix sp.]